MPNAKVRNNPQTLEGARPPPNGKHLESKVPLDKSFSHVDESTRACKLNNQLADSTLATLQSFLLKKDARG